MSHGFREGLLRLKGRTEMMTATLFGGSAAENQVDGEAASEHDLRDLGLLDGRVSPSTVERQVRPDAWDIIERSPRWL